MGLGPVEEQLSDAVIRKTTRHVTLTLTIVLLPGYAIDYMHWQVQLSKRFRALKLWFVIRSFGVEGLQEHVREGVRLAKYFENLVRQDIR